jgi:hypothetical protein
MILTIRALLMAALAATLTGCTNGAFTPTEEASVAKLAQDARRGRRGAAREALFVKCMELAAKMPRQSDDDVADVVSECSAQSWYMTNYMQ